MNKDTTKAVAKLQYNKEPIVLFIANNNRKDAAKASNKLRWHKSNNKDAIRRKKNSKNNRAEAVASS